MMNDKEENAVEQKTLKAIHLVALVGIFMAAILVIELNTADFKASVIPTKSASPYDGTALPVLKVPKWTALTQSEYKADYDQIPTDKLINTPVYDASILKTPTEQLGWKSESDLNIRNSKITFSVPYMGNYKLDGIENAGSHLAVDIKIPVNTPIYAIGNGVVVKTADQSTGFGKHIVIKHENFPMLEDQSKTTNLYSSYNHLSQILVAEGDVVTKGQLIAKSGNTGLASTPHIHFQIDNDQAPWHPYWPFTYQEAAAAGYSFNDAINAGLGKDKALKTTVNPLMYVQKYLNSSQATVTNTGNSNSGTTNTSNQLPPATTPESTANNSTAGETTNPTTGNSELPPVTATPVTTTVTTPAVTTPVVDATNDSSTSVNTITEPAVELQNPAVAFLINHDGSFVTGVPEKFVIKAVDVNGNVVKSYKPKDGVYFQILNGGANLPSSLGADRFIDGTSEFEVTPTADLGLKIKATDNNISGESEFIQGTLFSDIDTSIAAYKAITFLKKHEVIGGYPNGSFKPDTVVSRVEALKFILKGVNIDLQQGSTLPFKDTKVTEWYSDYVATAYNKEIVGGYPDSTFKPAKTVNRAEFIKMLLLASNAKVDQFVTRDVYYDVSKDAWYAPYVKYAKDHNLVDIRGHLFRPEEGMTRAEVADTIYRMIMLNVSGVDKYESSLTASSNAVDRYFE
jgi:murein DD-endopeptidase MepM/ murein hydrolase activator NlpD